MLNIKTVNSDYSRLLLKLFLAVNKSKDDLPKEDIDIESAVEPFIGDWDSFSKSSKTDDLKIDLEICEWFLLAILSPEKSNLREVCLRKIESWMMKFIGEVIQDPNNFHGHLNVIDIGKFGLEGYQLQDLHMMLLADRVCRAVKMDCYDGNEFWNENVTSVCVMALTNAMIISLPLKGEIIGEMVERSRSFRGRSVTLGIERYGRGP